MEEEQIALEPAIATAVADWQRTNGIADRADALGRLVEIGLEERYLVAHSKGEFTFDLGRPAVTHKATGFFLTVPGYRKPADVGRLAVVENAGADLAGEKAAVLRGAAIAYLRRVLLRSGAAPEES